MKHLLWRDQLLYTNLQICILLHVGFVPSLSSALNPHGLDWRLNFCPLVFKSTRKGWKVSSMCLGWPYVVCCHQWKFLKSSRMVFFFPMWHATVPSCSSLQIILWSAEGTTSCIRVLVPDAFSQRLYRTFYTSILLKSATAFANGPSGEVWFQSGCSSAPSSFFA